MGEQRVALVTGGAVGIGAGISERLAADGFEVIVTGRRAGVAAEMAERIGGRSLAFDVSDHAATVAAIQGAGRIDVLVNNAGWDHFDWFTDLPYETMRKLVAINLEGVLSCTQAALPSMQEHRWGRVITIGSEAGRIGSKGNAVYAACKAAAVGFSMSIARENARFGITANVVAPGPIETPLLREMTPHAIEVVTNQTQMKRLGTPEECAAAVSYLASEAAGYVTGEVLAVSGGMHLGG
ncbi:SDR family oxidoreductase [Paraconexibacter antarcticus]|uniref:SDR family oxidoreductase n=1 Tax=Paraconexibacter antarcticus TaxID=2949664 RepID=A0ABY5DQJ6_9ACTN|nr:SDR family oxidoreductase [Paraconexibacter antarcticus]UTI63508.1 SDR family oxidoreductase [Paraconexibacter antarcticus]